MIVGQNYVLQNGLHQILQRNLPTFRLGSPILLDIDLDFFGCDSPYVSMVQAGLSKEFIQGVHNNLLKSAQLCAARKYHSRLALDTAAEARANYLFTQIVLQLAQDPNSGEVGLNSELDRHNELLEKIVEDTNRCRLTAAPLTVPSLRQAIVSSFQVKQGGELQNGFTALAKYGFCIDTEEFPRESYKIGICIGSSDYDDDVSGRIKIHHPLESETTMAKRVMGQLIDQAHALMVHDAPIIITICRSMRDGYTPREILNNVEQGLLKDVDRLLTQTGRVGVIRYDKDLYLG